MKGLLKMELVLSLLVLMCMLSSCKKETDSIRLTIGDAQQIQEGEKFSEKMEKSGKEQYSKLQKIINEGKESGNSSVTSILLNYAFKKLKESFIKIVAVSEIVGILIYVFAQGNKRMRKLGLFGLCIFVPLVLLGIAFGGGWFMDAFGC